MVSGELVMLHSDFNRKLKNSSNNLRYQAAEAAVSASARSYILSAYQAADKTMETEYTCQDDLFDFGLNSATASSCTRTAHTRFGLPCKCILRPQITLFASF